MLATERRIPFVFDLLASKNKIQFREVYPLPIGGQCRREEREFETRVWENVLLYATDFTNREISTKISLTYASPSSLVRSRQVQIPRSSNRERATPYQQRNPSPRRYLRKLLG